MIISITGKPGSGKSTVGKLVAKELGYPFFSAGDLRGQIAMKHDMTIDQLNEVGKTEPWTDKECDDLLVKMGKEKDNIVFDSRLAWHFIPQSFKVFLDVDLTVAARRIFKDPRVDEAKAESEKEMHERLIGRMNADNARYKKWYNLNILRLKQYDLVIDTSNMTREQIVKRIIDRESAWLSDIFKNRPQSQVAMPIKKHDFVELEYTGRLKEGNDVFDTTDEKVAKEAKVYAKGAEYTPVVVCIGEHHMLPGLDEFLVGKDTGKFTVEVPQEKAFGRKDPSALKMVPTDKFEEQGIKPVVGLRLNIDGYVGIIKTVSGGRTVVDFNHPLAGRDVIYDIKVNKVVSDKKTQVEAILRVLLGLKTKVTMDGTKAKVDIPKLPAEMLAELSKKIKDLTGCDVDYIIHEPEQPNGKGKDAHAGHDHSHDGHDHSDPNHKH